MWWAKVTISPAMQTTTSVHGASCREANLVLHALRSFFSGERGCFEPALAEPVDWVAVERIAEYHSILPLVAFALRQYCPDLAPRDVGERLQQRLLLAARSNLASIAEWFRILQAFESSGIPAITLKGPALALLAYPNFSLREFNDLDLLVRPRDVCTARDVLLREGYYLRSPLAGDTDAILLRSRNRQLDFANDGRKALVDLHWGAWHAMFPFQLPVDQLFAAAQFQRHERISFLTLSPEHLLIYLCAHGTKHCWLNVRWLCDIACYVRAAESLDWELCIRLAEASNCNLVLKHSLLLAQRVLGLDLPPSIANDCDCPGARALVNMAMSMLPSEDDEVGYGQAMRFHLAFATGWRDRTRLIFERLFVPAEADWQQVHLPQSLQFLYYTVRPMRFMFTRLRRVSGGTI
jgi:hypothetical protein